MTPDPGSPFKIKRVIQQGGLELNGEKITDINVKISTSVEHNVKFGKRKFARIRFRKIS
jgi:tyrosyl-tRNA synthetase